MNREYHVIPFGLIDEENALVKKLPTRSYELYLTGTPADVIAIGRGAMIVNTSTLDQDSASMTFDIYSRIDGRANETVICPGGPKPPKEPQTFFKCRDSFGAIEDKLQYVPLTAHSKKKSA